MKNRGMEEFKTDSLEDHLSLDEIRLKMQTRPGFLTLQKWLVIYNFIVHPRPLSQIAMHTGLSESTVYRIISDYNRLGPEAFDIDGNSYIYVVS
jgi:DNA-binding MarR family transcriptional regulator